MRFKGGIQYCRRNKTSETTNNIGNYRGFDMLLSFDSFNKEFHLDMKGSMTHTAVLGNDRGGNITRINNAFDKIPQRLVSVEAHLETLERNAEKSRIMFGGGSEKTKREEVTI